MTVPDQVKAARKVSTPLVGITTADQPATVAALVRSYTNGKPPPMLQHDVIRGLIALNDPGAQARAKLVDGDGPALPGVVPLQSPAECLSKAAELPARAILCVLNASRLLDDAAIVQAICNLRDLFKADSRTLILLAPALALPAELVQDILVIDERLPTEDEIRSIIDQELQNATASLPTPPETPTPETLTRAVEALAGLAAFPAEQSIALTLAQGRIDVAALWARKRSVIGQTRGLSMDTARETFADIGGLNAAKTFGRALFAGRNPPRAVVRIDEIEKMLAGAAGDTSGTSQDALGTILREMEDQDWAGLIAVGPPGAAKSLYSKALATTHGAPTFALDMGAAKGSLVGQSEERIRSAMKVIKAVAGSGAFFLATCNKLDALPPELRRRFRYGLWFFDLPTSEERAAIWTINLARFGLSQTDAGDRPDDTYCTGADIRNCSELAWRLRQPLTVAAQSLVPVAVSDPGSIERLRQTAAGKFLSASYPGVYRHPSTVTQAPPSTSGRRYQN